MGEEINYRLLRKIQQMEKKSPKLTEINNDFYILLSNYLKNLQERLQKEKNFQRRRLLEEEVENINRIAVNIYEQREKKILLAAISKLRGGNPQTQNFVDFEKEIYDSVLKIMQNMRKKVFSQTTDEVEQEKTVDEKEFNNENKREKTGGTNTNHVNKKPIVIVKEDLPEFIGTDEKKYYLKKNDVLSMPQDMVDVLIKRDKVRKIKTEQHQLR